MNGYDKFCRRPDSRPWLPVPYRPDDCCRPQPPCRRCGHDDTSIKLRLFDGCSSCHDNCCHHPLPPAAPPVTIVNPWNCRESVQVTLSVDECGNLVVYVKR